MGRRHRAGHDPRRARRQRRRAVGARGRPHGRARAAGPRDGAPVPHHRGHAGGRRPGAGRSMLHIIDFEGEIYMRQERQGMLIGTYERAGVPWSPQTTPWDFGHELLPHDLDRIAPSPRASASSISRALAKRRHQARSSTGRSPSRPTAIRWSARCGACATTGWPAASWRASARAAASASRSRNWMIEGDPGADIWAMDVARYGDWATPAYTNAKVRENYSRRFRISFPNEELPAARPLRTTPLYDRLQGAGRGVRRLLRARACAVVRAQGHASRSRTSPSAAPMPSRRSARNAGRCASGVGLIEISNYGKYRGHGGRAPRPGCRGSGQPHAGRRAASR